MSIASRLFNIARSQLEERLRRLEEHHKISPDEPTNGGSKKRGSQSAGGGRGRSTQDARSAASGQDPDMARWYANLEVPYGSDFDTVQTAWKKLVRSYHPDRHGQDPERQATATEILKELNNAYEQLKKRLDTSRSSQT